MHVRLRSANLDECFGLLLSRQADVAIVYHLPDDPGDAGEEFLETIEIGQDRLIPVCDNALAARLTAPLADIEMPVIDYPAHVFFGKVMAARITPVLDASVSAISRAETALTLAAMEMAAGGVGVAWVPASVARPQIASGRIVDLSACLPSCALLVRAVRLTGKPGPAETALWSQLIALGKGGT